MHQPSGSGHNASTIWRELRASGKKCYIAIFLPACETQRETGTLGSCCPHFFSQALRASCWIWGAAEDERLPLCLCGTRGVDSDHIRRRPSSGDCSSNREIPSSSVLPWVGTEMTGSLGVALLCILCVFGEEGRSCASSRWKALLFRAALITIDYISSQGPFSLKPSECVPLSFCTEGRGPSSAWEKNTGFGIRSGSPLESAVT